MPIPFIFPIAGFVMTGAGMAMIVRYIQADQVRRGKLDTWLTDCSQSYHQGVRQGALRHKSRLPHGR